MSTTLVEVRHLTRRYGARVAVDAISFSLKRGDVLGFLGPNGAGKSTTMQMLGGVLAPTAGEVVIDGHDLLEAPVAARGRLGYLPDTPPLYADMTVEEYLRYCGALHRLRGDTLKRRLADVLDRCGLGEVRRRLIGKLSKGFQQRTGIAQAILHDPAVIILDEPTVGLDPIQMVEIRRLIGELAADHAIILATHILPEVQTVCNRIQIMHHGRLVYTTDNLTEDDAPRFVAGFRRAADAGALLAIEGVETAEPVRLPAPAQALHGWQIETSMAAEALCSALAALDLGLAHFCRQQASLEQRFIALTCYEAPQEDAAA